MVYGHGYTAYIMYDCQAFTLETMETAYIRICLSEMQLQRRDAIGASHRLIDRLFY
jgi:hypothetical protein